MLLTILGAFIGAVLSIATTIAVELLRRPRFKFSIEFPHLDVLPEAVPPFPFQRPFQSARYLRILVKNAPLRWFAKWMVRMPALQCRALISFHHLDGQNVFGRSMKGRWSGSLEPGAVPIIGDDGKKSAMIDLTRLTAESRIDVYPGETKILDIVVRAENDVECYGWNNEAYSAAAPGRNPAWKLDPGRYLVHVEITSSGHSRDALFRIINDVGRTDFRLEPATKKDMAAIRR